ncbi:MAG TPA: hypothetical protein VGO00_17770 [Kofleriaceae bacterium]|nr:hypothetical protein [Kofleriaceae bacterium]
MEHEQPTRRRYRPVLGVSGLTLFICLLLPFARTCRRDEVELTLPTLWAPYLFGALFCVLSAVRSPRATRAVVRLLHTVSYLFVGGAVLVTLWAPAIGLIELVVAAIITIALGNNPRESRLAATTIIIGALWTAWFAFLSTFEDSLYGVRVALVASVGILGSALLWRYDIALGRPEEPVPRAVARKR